MSVKQKLVSYDRHLKRNARQLRKAMTDSERLLWSRLRGKQLLGVQFYRQKPIGPYIVDFYAAKASLIIEVDGSQHFTTDQPKEDQNRTAYLNQMGLMVLRFDNRQVLLETDAVVQNIYNSMLERLDR